MKGRSVAIVALLCAAAAFPPVAPKTRWTFAYDLKEDTFNGGPPDKPKAIHHRQTYCMGPMTRREVEEVADGALVEGCGVHQMAVSGDRLSFTAICPPDADGVTFDFDADGIYNDRSMKLSLRARGSDGKDQATLSGTVIGTRIGMCH